MMFVPWYNSLDFLVLQPRLSGVEPTVERKKIEQVIPGMMFGLKNITELFYFVCVVPLSRFLMTYTY